MDQVGVICHILPCFDKTYTVSVTFSNQLRQIGRNSPGTHKRVFLNSFFCYFCFEIPALPNRLTFICCKRGVSCSSSFGVLLLKGEVLAVKQWLASVVPLCISKLVMQAIWHYILACGKKQKLWMTNCRCNGWMCCWMCSKKLCFWSYLYNVLVFLFSPLIPWWFIGISKVIRSMVWRKVLLH